MLAGVKIVTTYEHAAGGSLSERAVSTVGEGAPNTILLDGVAHPTKIGGRDATVRAVERPETGVVRIETTLPGGAGHIVDERRVLGGGGELERTIELTLEGKPPIKLHRLLVRTPESAPPQRWAGAGASPPAGDSVTIEVVVPLPPPPPLARRSLLRREAHVTARFVLAEGTSWAEAATRWRRSSLRCRRLAAAAGGDRDDPEKPPLVVEESADALVVRGGDAAPPFASRSERRVAPSTSGSSAGGASSSAAARGRRCLRAPTDNDNGGAMNSLPRPHKAVLAGSHMVWWLWIGFWPDVEWAHLHQLSYADTWRRDGQCMRCAHGGAPSPSASRGRTPGALRRERAARRRRRRRRRRRARLPRRPTTTTAAAAAGDASLRVRRSTERPVRLSATTVSAECPSLPRARLAFELKPADLGAVGYGGRGPHEKSRRAATARRLAEFRRRSTRCSRRTSCPPSERV